MNDVVLSVRIAVEPQSDGVEVNRDGLVASTKEAVEDALSAAEQEGFRHTLSDKVSLVVTGVDA